MKTLPRRLCALLCICALLVTPASALRVEDALDLLEQSYINKIPPQAYDAETLDELFAAIGDPYTYYMTAEEYRDFLSGVESESTVTGLGASILYTEDGILLESILPGGSAEAVGLAAGDLIIAINGAPCVPADETHRMQLVGEAGTAVTVSVRHADGFVRDYVITRRTVELHNTAVTVKNGNGFISCESFGSQTGTYFSDGVSLYDDQVGLWVVDLRGNGGGLSSAAIDAVGAFAGSSSTLYFRDRNGRFFRNAYRGPRLTEHPVIVLTDSRSASASEIFAGGIRAAEAGISVGERTYGKGVAQIVYDADASPLFSGDALKVTAYRFYLADGNTTDRIGVIPTLCMDRLLAPRAAALLCGQRPEDGQTYLRLVLNGLDFYVDLIHAQEDKEALQALLSALAPDAVLLWGQDSAERMITVGEACARCSCRADERSFSDVSPSAYADKINALGTYRLIFGDGSGTFRPSDTMTRAEVCCLLAQALGISSAADSSCFVDVPSDSWYAGNVNAMASLGLVNGIGNGRFAPFSTMTQEEFLAVLGRLAEFLNLDACGYLKEHPLGALEPLACYRNYSFWSIRSIDLLTNFHPDGANLLFTELEALEPKMPILREQAAAAMYHVLTGLGILSY